MNEVHLPRASSRAGRTEAGSCANLAARSLASKVGSQPGIIAVERGVDRTRGQDPTTPDGDDPIANGMQAVQVMCNHENPRPQRLAESPDQFVELSSADRIEARGRLVEKQDLRVERQCPCKRGALVHAA